MTTTKVKNLPLLGNITTGDKLVTERVAGATSLSTFVVKILEDTSPTLGGNLNASSYNIIDSSNRNLIRFSPVANAVNEITIVNGSTGSGPAIAATGSDGAINMRLQSKTTGVISLESTSSSPLVISSGTNFQHTTTYTMANTAASRTITIPDYNGTLMIASGEGTSGQLMVSQGAGVQKTWTTPTFPTTSVTSRKIMISDGTNWIASSETYAVPGTSGKIMQSDGTNWTSATTTGTGVPVLATSPTLVTPAIGVPSSGTLNNCTGLPISGGISGLGTGIATFLATPSSANFATAMTDETGSGALVFATSPTLVTPVLGTPTSGTLTNCTGLPVVGGGTGLASATAYAVLCGGTTSTGAHQSIASVGTSGQILTSNGASNLPTFQVKHAIQTIRSLSGASATGTTLIPADDTIPQITEGDQYLTAIITPTSASSILEVTAVINGAHSATGYLSGAIFQDAGVNALASSCISCTGNLSYNFTVKDTFVAGTTSATTIRLRIGGNTSGTFTFNGAGGNRIHGGAQMSSLVVKERSP